MTTQVAPTTETPEPQAPVVTEQAVVEQPPVASAAPPVAAAPETPAPASVAPPVAPAPPVIDPRDAYIAGLERQNRETQARLDQEASVTAIARRQEALVADGVEPAQAQAIATEIVQARTQGQTQVAEMRAKVLYAGQLADQHKVSVASLMQYDTPEAMRQAVDRLAAEGSQAAELARLREENVKLKKGQVPTQTFDSGRGAGGAVATADNIDKLYMDWERQEMNNPNPRLNPYAAKYQRFLSTGSLT